MKIFFSVGEPSGDVHGANLIRELRRQNPSIEAVGFGGPRMAAAGCQLHTDLTQLAVMLLFRALVNLHRFLALLWQADRYFRDQRPDAVVLIDFPGFNWWIARRAKARGIPVIYYGTPQLWGWAGWRVKRMRKYVDHIICKLPFEVQWYAERGCRALFVGHPFFDQLSQQTYDDAFLAEQQRRAGRLVAILPGSRMQEVEGNLPTFLKAAAEVQQRLPETRFAIASFNERQARVARQMLADLPADQRPRADVFVERTPELMKLADCCIACSGSVSLELMYHAKPTVIHYKVHRLGMQLQQWFRNVRYITLVNLLAVENRFRHDQEPAYDPDAPQAEDVPFPEYLTNEDKSGRIAGWIERWLTDEPERLRRVRWLERLRTTNGSPGASRAAAEYILAVLRPTSGVRQAA